MKIFRTLQICAVSAVLGLLAGAPSASAEGVGKAGAVKPVSTGTPPGASSRALEGGSVVFFKEKINTSPSGGLQVLFLDSSTLGVGPSTDITIDEFVYDPNAGTGKLVTSITKGSFRFLSGGVARGQEITIRTPGATVGIRG